MVQQPRLQSMQVFRITTKKWSNSLTGSGYSARWNSEGTLVIYTAENRSLACLENLVHRNGHGLDDNFCVMTIDILNTISVLNLDVNSLTPNWNFSDESAQIYCRSIGDKWILEKKSCILKVPSALIDGEFNILINPNHKDFHKIKLKSTEKFTFDNRLKTKKS